MSWASNQRSKSNFMRFRSDLSAIKAGVRSTKFIRLEHHMRAILLNATRFKHPHRHALHHACGQILSNHF